MNSNALKTIVMKDRVLYGPDLYCATELLNHADVITVNPRGYIYEFEIKVTRSDLKSELDAMYYWLSEDRVSPYQLHLVDDGVEQMKKGNASLANKILRSEKWAKHHSYLVNESSRYKRPRCFYFVVTRPLEEYALSRLANSPYGLYVAHKTDTTGYMHNKKKAVLLSKNKMDDRDKAEIMQRIQTENIMLKIERHLKATTEVTDLQPSDKDTNKRQAKA